MSQCVPSWDLDDNSTAPRLPFRSQSNSTAPDVPMSEYEVAELTWENGQLAMHGLGPPRVPSKSQVANWEKPRASGTLESIVNQATRSPLHRKPTTFEDAATAAAAAATDELVPWFENRNRTPAPSATITMDALVPCSNRLDKDRTTVTTQRVMDSTINSGSGGGRGGSGCVGCCSTRVGPCSVATAADDQDMLLTAKRARAEAAAARVAAVDHSVSGSATFGTGRADSQHVTVDTCEREFGGGGGGGFTSTSFGSQENTKTNTADDHDSVCHSRSQRELGGENDKKKGNGKSSVSNKRSRAAAIHNQSERKRRDKINQRMKTLQKLVPNSSKTDKASMLDEVIEYLKQLQAQVQMLSRMNMPPMMLPMAMQQQLQMSMMAPMGMGMGMGMGIMDMNTIGRPNITGISPVISPTAFLPIASWDAGSGDRLQAAPTTVMADPLSTFLACQSQPMTMDAYSRMAAMYHQLQQQQQQQQPPPATSSKT